MALRLLLVIWLVVGSCFAEDDALGESAIFRSEVQLAMVQFHVTSYNGYVPGLTAEDFKLVEDGRNVPISVFENASLENQNIPVEVILLLDSSGSVTSKQLLNEELFRSNLLEGLPGVSLSIYHFGSHLVRMSGATRDPARIRKAFEGVVQRVRGQASVRLGPPYGPSLIYEAIAAAIRDTSRSRTVSRKLVVVVSDGLQNGGAADPARTIQYAMDTGVPVYPIVVGSRPGLFNQPDAATYKFVRIGERTGGVEFQVGKLDDETVKNVIEFIADRVRHLYVVGYAPDAQSPPKRRKVQVRLQPRAKGKLVGGARFVVH